VPNAMLSLLGMVPWREPAGVLKDSKPDTFSPEFEGRTGGANRLRKEQAASAKSTLSGALTSAPVNTSIPIRDNAAEVLRRLATAAGPSQLSRKDLR
jgi:hypothetical protein